MAFIRTLKIGCVVSASLLCVSIIGFCYPSKEERNLKKLDRTIAWMRIVNVRWQSYASLQAKQNTAMRAENVDHVEQLDWNAVGSPISFAELKNTLASEYIKTDWMHSEDAWGHPFEFRLVGMDLMIRSPGRDGVFSKQTYIPCVFEINDVSQDIVLWGGKFKRHPLLPLVEDSLLDEHMVRQAERDRARLRRCD